MQSPAGQLCSIHNVAQAELHHIAKKLSASKFVVCCAAARARHAEQGSFPTHGRSRNHASQLSLASTDADPFCSPAAGSVVLQHGQCQSGRAGFLVRQCRTGAQERACEERPMS